MGDVENGGGGGGKAGVVSSVGRIEVVKMRPERELENYMDWLIEFCRIKPSSDMNFKFNGL